MANRSIQRIQRDIEKYIPLIIQRESKDDLLRGITITGCSLANDLSFCKVYFTSLFCDDKKKLLKEVNEAAPFIRGRLAKMMNIRNTPELRFDYDNSIEYGQRIDEVIKKIHEGE